MKKLSEDQQAAYEELVKFLERKNKSLMFCLKGYAGTGKTYLITHFIEMVLKKHPRWRIAMTAPTNKAVQVLRDSSTINSDNLSFLTIHRLLGLKEKILDSGEIEFVADFDQSTNIRSFKMLIIDEVSMLADELFYEIRRYNSDLHIIMMGDPAQIPPVNKDDCEPFLNPEEHNITSYQLTQIMRQGNDSAIVKMSMNIRENLQIETHHGWSSEKDMSMYNLSNGDHVIKLRELFPELYRDMEAAQRVRVIAWTNKKVQEYNKYIRKLMFGENAPMFVEGEMMVMNEPFETRDMNKLHTNQEVTITELVTGYDNLEGIMHAKIYDAEVSYTNEFGNEAKGRIAIIHPDSLVDFMFKCSELKNDAVMASYKERKEAWKQYYAFMRSVANLSYGYAITAHKAQGSTYERAIVDVRNISQNPKTVERNRILYTAITRAKSELIVLL